MRKVALLTDKDREELFSATSVLVGIRPEAIEIDFWVCYLLDHLFFMIVMGILNCRKSIGE